MVMVDQSIGRLRERVDGLPPEARSRPLDDPEVGLRRDQDVPDADASPRELTYGTRNCNVKSKRVGNPSRLFFSSIEPFLVDGIPEARRRGEIAHASLGAVWAWICRDLMPDRAKSYCEAIDRSPPANDRGSARRVVRAFRDQVSKSLERALATTAHEVIRDRLVLHGAPRRGLDDLREILMVLKGRDALAALADRLPPTIWKLDGQQLEQTRAALEELARTEGDMVHYGLILVMRRLAAPWQLIRLAFLAEDGDGAVRRTPYGVAIGLVLRDSEEIARRVHEDVQTGDAAMAAAALTHLEATIEGLNELDLPTDSVWARRLSVLRNDFAILQQADAAPIASVLGQAFSGAHPSAGASRA